MDEREHLYGDGWLRKSDNDIPKVGENWVHFHKRKRKTQKEKVIKMINKRLKRR